MRIENKNEECWKITKKEWEINKLGGNACDKLQGRKQR